MVVSRNILFVLSFALIISSWLFIINPSDEPDFLWRATNYYDFLGLNVENLQNYEHSNSRGNLIYNYTGEAFDSVHFILKLTQVSLLLSILLLVASRIDLKDKVNLMAVALVPSFSYLTALTSFEALATFISVIMYFYRKTPFFLLLLAVLFVLDIGTFFMISIFYSLIYIYVKISLRKFLWLAFFYAMCLLLFGTTIENKILGIITLDQSSSHYILLRPLYTLATVVFGSSQGLLAPLTTIVVFAILILYSIRSRIDQSILFFYAAIVFIISLSLIFPKYSYGKYYIFLLPFLLEVVPTRIKLKLFSAVGLLYSFEIVSTWVIF